MEKLEGLPVAPFMDREKVTKSSSQIGFIKYALLPLFEALGTQYPVIEVGSYWCKNLSLCVILTIIAAEVSKLCLINTSRLVVHFTL